MKKTKENQKVIDELIYNDYTNNNLSISQLIQKYKLTESSIFRRLRAYNPDYQRRSLSFKRWTNKEVLFLIDNYDSMKTIDIAKALNRDVKSIQNKALALGLSKIEPETKLKLISKLKKGDNVKSISNDLSLSLKTVYNYKNNRQKVLLVV